MGVHIVQTGERPGPPSVLLEEKCMHKPTSNLVPQVTRMFPVLACLYRIAYKEQSIYRENPGSKMQGKASAV